MFLDAWLAWDDLFVLGIGLDLVGAVLLAMGVIPSLRSIVDARTPKYGYNSTALVHGALERLRGFVGVSLLSSGFLVQALGYLVALGTVDSDSTGWRRVGGAVILMGVGAGIGIAINHLVYRVKFKSSLVEIARFKWEDRSDGQGQRLSRLTPADPAILCALGKVRWAELPRERDDADAYCKRVFGAKVQLSET